MTMNFEANVCKAETKSLLERRKSVWELGLNVHCSVCGTCLSVAEQRNMLKKLNLREKEYRDYEIHALFVNSLHMKNRLSLMVNAHLEKKYRLDINQYACLPEEELMSVWRKKMAEGNVCGLYWVMLTNPNLSDESINLVVGEVHMLSHLNGGICRHERMKLKRMTEEKQGLKLRLHQSKAREREWAGELEAARMCIGKLEKQIRELQAEAVTGEEAKAYRNIIDSLKKENDELHSKLAETGSKCHDYKKESRRLVKDNAALERQVLEQKETIVELCREIKKLARCNAGAVSSAEAEGGESKKGKLLMVGGNCRLNPFYRDLAEHMGWEFRHHDGCLGGGRQSLMEMLKWSDLILCSLDINSHGAVHCVKDLAGKYDKEYRLLGSISLSRMARALAEESGA
ncbi:DUF2325 domain-containing protein [Syntrophomonas curvata]